MGTLLMICHGLLALLIVVQKRRADCVKLVFIRLIRLSRHFSTLQRLAALLTAFVLFRAFSARLLFIYFASILLYLIRVSVAPLILYISILLRDKLIN